jgi:hypothetical protein
MLSYFRGTVHVADTGLTATRCSLDVMVLLCLISHSIESTVSALLFSPHFILHFLSHFITLCAFLGTTDSVGGDQGYSDYGPPSPIGETPSLYYPTFYNTQLTLFVNWISRQ